MQGYTTLGIPEVMLFPGVMLAMLLAVLMAVLRGASTGTSIDAELLLSLAHQTQHDFALQKRGEVSL